jgi:DNA-binding response OmpR family regulator
MVKTHHALAEGTATDRVLVVEADANDARRIAMVLDAYGYELDLVTSAEEAIRLDPKRYALVICDAFLPGVDGRTFAEIVRREEGEAAPPFVFIGAAPGDLRPFEICLEKPFSMRELVATLAVALGMRLSGVVEPPIGRSAGAAAPSCSGDLLPGGGDRPGRASH